ncbi:hypothetical protein [Aquidulcibacter paucihalophilus]|uniref:hypothetical protein n=1 Tax=Aquidulcibacter paucihalophilus TaxID=1978549 RepID=UPI000A195C2A|nr:hypothetical protein [Aquidulcibacter paucihalophilus]
MVKHPKLDGEIEAVLNRLASGSEPGQPVPVQIFLDPTVDANGLSEFVRMALESSAIRNGFSAEMISVGKARKLSHSISAVAPVKVLRELMTKVGFTGLLPGNLAAGEVMFKPIDENRK